MIPDIGWWEFLLVAVVALIVVGPKDLPKLLRTLGQWAAKARSMAREFQRGFEEMAQQAEVNELKSELREIHNLNPVTHVKKEIDDAMAGLDPSRHEETRKTDPDFDLNEDASRADADTEASEQNASHTSEPTSAS